MAALYCALYLLLAWVSQVRSLYAPGISPWRPQEGLTLAFLALAGWRWMPLAALAQALAVWLLASASAPAIVSFVAGVWDALCLAALALALSRDLRSALRPTVVVARSAAFSAVVTLLLSSGHVGAYWLHGDLPGSDFGAALTRHWVATLNGVLLALPCLQPSLVRHFAAEWRRQAGRLSLEYGSAIAMLVLVLLLPAADQLRYFYLLFVPVIWIAMRCGWVGALAAVLVLQIGLLLAATERVNTLRFIDLQFLMLTLALTGLILGAVVSERSAAWREVAERDMQQRERDRAMQRAMRFAVAGELAASVAHELNQPLTATVSYLQSCALLAEGADPLLRDTLGRAQAEAQRAAGMLRQLRNFYVSGQAPLEDADLAVICRDVVQGLQPRLQDAKVTLDVTVEPDLPVIRANCLQLQLILHNLFANAIDALANAPAPRRIAARLWCVADAICIRVDDSGAGVDPGLLATLFEPFVSGKPSGMGLGLAISRSFVRARGGRLEVGRSDQLGGASFIITLPRNPPSQPPVC